MDDIIFDNLMKARQAAQEQAWSTAEKYYLSVLVTLENQENDFDSIQYLDIKVEYLCNVRTPSVIKSQDLDSARDYAIEALNLIHKAKQKSVRAEDIDRFNVSEKNILKKIILEFGCILPKNDKHYTIKCPIHIKDHFRVNSVSPTILYERIVCSICRQSKLSCDHQTGKRYGNQVAKRIFEGGRILDISFVSIPKDHMSSSLIIYNPKSNYEDRLSSEEQEVLTQKGMYCHLCRLKRIDPQEVTYEIFIDMQEPLFSPEGLSSDDIYVGFHFRLPQGVDAASAKGKPAIRFHKNSGYYHIPSSTLSNPPAFRDQLDNS